MFQNYIRAPNGAEAKPVSQLHKGQYTVFWNGFKSGSADHNWIGTLDGSIVYNLNAL